MNNLEWLRTLSEEEILPLLSAKNPCNFCIYTNPECTKVTTSCKMNVSAWLKQEHKEEIKPCANCGGEAKFVSDVKKLNPDIGYVQCCECHMRTTVGRKNDVIKTWNRRVDDAD